MPERDDPRGAAPLPAGPVTVSFENDFAILSVDDRVPLWKAFAAFNDAIEARLAPLSSREVVLATGGRSVASGELARLFFQAVNKFNLNVVRIFSEAADLDAKCDLPVPVEPVAKMKAYLARQQIFEARAVLFVKRTVRSGQTIDFQGHVVVYGNVNPGATIRATGSVTVFGKLLGSVWAGSAGDAQCFIVAREIDPVQIRVADYGLPGSEARRKAGPGREVAVVIGGGLELVPTDDFLKG